MLLKFFIEFGTKNGMLFIIEKKEHRKCSITYESTPANVIKILIVSKVFSFILEKRLRKEHFSANKPIKLPQT